jgi:glycosyltransferase involved in cell wall biosynthesis
MMLACLPLLVGRSREYDLIYVSGFKALGIVVVLVSKLLHKRCILKADSNGEMSGAFFAGGLRKVGLTPTSAVFRLALAVRNSILRRADGFVAISSDIAYELASCGVRADHIYSLPNSVDTTRFAPVGDRKKAELRRRLKLPQHDVIVIFTGRLVSYKGLPLLLRVWEQVRREHVHATLLLVGSGGLDIHNCEDELRAYVQAHGMQATVQFTGDVENVHEYLQASDIFIFPTEKEAFGISLIEAMACGLPVIATPTGGIKDILSHGLNGLVVPAGDFQQLYQALHTLMTHALFAATLGSAALQTVRERYARQVVASRYIELFSHFTCNAAS